MNHLNNSVHRGSGSRILIIVLSLLTLGIFGGATAVAQNPAYNFALGIGSTDFETSSDIAVDASGNMYVTGSFKGTVDFDPGTGTVNLTSVTTGPDIFIASYDATGTYRWAFSVGGTPPTGMSSDNHGRSIAVDESGNVVVSGNFIGTMDFDPGAGSTMLSAGTWNTFVAKYTPTGNFLWAFKIGPYSSAYNDVAIDAAGSVVVVGTFRGTHDFNPGSGTANLSSAKVSSKKNAASSLDIFVAKYSSTGAYQWAFRIGNQHQDWVDAVDIDDNGNIYITGMFGEVSSTVDFNPGSGTANLTGYGTYVARYSSAGAYLWAFKLAAVYPVGSGRIAVEGGGSVVVSGGFQGTVDFDPSSGTASLTGVSTNGRYDIFIARYSSAGSYQWAFTPAAEGSANGLIIDGSGDVYVTGIFEGVNDFDPGSGTVSLPTQPYTYAGFAASYSAAGAYQWAFSMPGVAHGRGIATDNGGDIYLTGEFGATAYPTVDFDPSEATANLTAAGDCDIFLATYTEATILKQAVHAQAGRLEIVAEPNPFTGYSTLRYSGAAGPVRIEVVDLMGRVIETIEDIAIGSEIRLGDDLPPGAYLVRLTQAQMRGQMMIRKVR